MNDEELQSMKEELGTIFTQLGNVEGYFDNFNTTLNNHMTDYARQQIESDKKIKDLRTIMSWAFWVIFTLQVLILGAFTTGAILLLQYVVNMIGGQ